MSRFAPCRLAGFAGLLILLMLSLVCSPAASAQTLPFGIGGSDKPEQGPSAQELQQSLDQVIGVLQNEAQRNQLLDELEALREANNQVRDKESLTTQQGLLGALAETFTDLGEQASSDQSPLVEWKRQLKEGWVDWTGLLMTTGNSELAKFTVNLVVLLSIWVGFLVLFIALGRIIAARNNWPLDLPREPKGGLMVFHFLRRLLPWALSFAVTLGIAQLLPESAGRMVGLVLAYVALCGRVLSVVVETVISVFTSGHRFTAVHLLHRGSLRPLFLIGAFIALGDALNTARIIDIMGEDLAGLMSVLSNILAAVLSIRFIIRFKRPISHLITNRSYSDRRDASSAIEMVRVLGGLWHVPALLLVCGSLVAIFISGGDVGSALARSIISAALLVLALVMVGLIRRNATRRSKRRRSEYRQRLERFGYVLARVLTWIVFGELFLQVWGGSLVGIGQQGVASVRIGQALLAIGFTGLIAWLVWIFADTGIQRALVASAGARGRRVNLARAQTITPMIRNIIFITIVIIASIVGLANLGVNVTPLLAGAGVIGLGLGFGAKTLVQDLITGIFIIIEDSLAVEDFVRINGHMGTVEGLTLRTVRLRDLDGVVHIITFSRIDSIHNMSRQFGIALMKIRIPYDMKIDDAIQLMQENALALRKDPMMRHHIWSPLEMQGIHAFEDGCAILRMRFRTSPEMQWDVMRAFNLMLKRRMEEQSMDLGVPRISVGMEGIAGGRLNKASGDNSSPDASEGTERRDASGRRPGDAGSADPGRNTSATGASPDPS
ncbi:mechanosensitive ion channel family protein [Halomonas halocynthiae]|uniref:mechanosensitive ion channel family protein n=1 Tax=Halomonas halocynthiae TaxID=176290 RepID=UPI00040FEC68|nr:mechanosensitive ion channel family protein [Halomonas halocynthiae]